MASKMVRLLIFFLIGILLSISTDARPCKSIFVSFSLIRHRTLTTRDPLSEMAIIIDVTEFKSSASSSEARFHRAGEDIFLPDLPHPMPIGTQDSPLGFSYDFSSLRDRTKDILSVVVALLFGVGCGALTAATMYLAYSLCANRFSYRSFEYDEFDDYHVDDKENIKKMGYVKIPDDTAPVKAVV